MQLLVAISLALIGSTVAADNKANDNARATTVEIIRKTNHPVEIHRVTTEDGYILTIHRIPGGSASPAAGNKTVVFLMHGLLESSADWVLAGPDKGFADAGYDVWMGNARGNVYSRDHVNIAHLTKKEYWHFDWHEVGYYDLPAMIDHILESTGRKKLIYIGHSQGTTAFYVLTSSKLNYNDKIEVMFSLAPAAYIQNMRSPIVRISAQFMDSIQLFSKLFGVYEIQPSDELLAMAAEIFCNDKALTQDICLNFLFLLFGFDQEQMNTTLLPTILGHFPAGSSVRQLIHYAQTVISRKFRWHDHGIINNLMVYGSPNPPDYNLTAITTPIHLMYGENDFLAVPKDVKQLYSELGNPVELYRVRFAKWNHIDFIWGIDAPELVYKPILKTLRKSYNNQLLVTMK